MLKVLLVDDEPFILQGLKVLIDWEQEGFEIAGAVSDGREALKFLEKHQADLIFADINMPGVSGLELLKKIREGGKSDAYFVILSGYADFSYAQKAIRYECSDYILKPIEKVQLLEILRKVKNLKEVREEKTRANQKMERAYLERNMIAVIRGKYDSVDLGYIKAQMHISGVMRYIEIDLDEKKLDEEISDEDKRACQRKLVEICRGFLQENGDHCFFDVSGQEGIYDAGFVYCSYMAKEKNKTEREYLECFMSYVKDAIQVPVVMLVGKQTEDIGNLAKSYGTVCILRSCIGFLEQKEIYYYETEVQVSNEGIFLCKDEIDRLILAIEENEPAKICGAVDGFFKEMQKMGAGMGEFSRLNINYLVFQLIHLATKQDDNVNQEEILRRISEHSFREGAARGSRMHLCGFALEYAEYLAQLRKNVSRGVLGEVEREMKERYMENLTLKELSETYYVNSAYLGQLFRKKYGCSFKDYLNEIRMEEASSLLVHTDKKIIEIAEEVGYRNLDYFVNRFINAKGCTPAKYRRQARN